MPGERKPWMERRERPADSRRAHDQLLSLVHAHDRHLRMLVYRLLGDADAMDDVLQEAYLKAYEGLPRFRGDADPATWLYRITYNLCIDRMRTQRRREAWVPAEYSLEDLSEEGWDPEGGGEDPAEQAAGRADLATTLAALSPEHRAAVLLVDAIGYDYRAAAEVLGVREGTLASRLHDARSALRKTLAASRPEERR